MKHLRLATDLSLPLSAVTESIAILAKRRAGKSTTARRLAEQLHYAGQQVVVADPKGDWWGLRFARDGVSPGLPFIVLGGEHADVPLEATGGELVARLVVEQRASVILDLGLFRKAEVCRFMTSFMETLYRLKAQEKHRTPMMLIIDEADAIAPQKPFADEARMVGAASDLVRRGGQRGIGVTMLTQRSAVLNKDLLTQIGILIVLQTIAPQDRKAIEAWIDVHGTTEERRELLAAMPSLAQGEGFVWAPGWPTPAGIFRRTRFELPDTFDSSKTPEGGKVIEPKNAAAVDLDAFRKDMAATIEKAKADDPRELRRRIAELTREVEQAKRLKVSVPAGARTQSVEILTDDDRKLLAKFGTWVADHRTFLESQRAGIRERFEAALDGALDDALKRSEVLATRGAEAFTEALNRTNLQRVFEKLERVSVAPQESSRNIPRPVLQRVSDPVHKMHAKGQTPATGDTTLGKAERAILTVLAQYPEGCEVVKLTLLSGYRFSGGFRNSLSVLRTAGYIEGSNTSTMRITEAGHAAIGEVPPLPAGEDLRAYWLGHPSLGKCERAVLSALFAHPAGMKVDALCTATGYEFSGGFRNSLSTLRTAGLIEGKNTETMRAAAVLLEA